MTAPLGWWEKRALLAHYFGQYGPFRFVVETGIYNGQGSCFQFEDRAEVVAIEADDVSAARARAEGHDVRTCDSADLLPLLLYSRNAPALFWLDAHPVVDGSTEQTPLLAELEAIAEWPHAPGSVVLVDDLRLFGLPGWPTHSEVMRGLPGFWASESRDDVLRLTPA